MDSFNVDNFEFDAFLLESFAGEGFILSEESVDFEIDNKPKINRKRKSRQAIVNTGGKNYVKYNDGTDEVTEWKRNQYLQQTPKIAKTDVRYNYLTMIMNIHNSQDHDQSSSFYTTFATSDFVQYFVVDEFISNKPSSLRKPQLSKTNAQGAVQQWYNMTQVLPDIIVRLLQAKVHTSSDTKSSKIIGYADLSATKVFNLDSDITMNFKNLQDRFISPSLQPPTHLLCGTDNTPISTQINTVLENSPLLPEPEPVTQCARITLHCDENGYIERIDIESVNASDVPTDL